VAGAGAVPVAMTYAAEAMIAVEAAVAVIAAGVAAPKVAAALGEGVLAAIVLDVVQGVAREVARPVVA